MRPDVYTLSDGRRIEGLHPDQVREVAGVLQAYGGDPGPLGHDAIAHALAASLAWLERQRPRLCAACRRHPSACVCGGAA